MKQNPQWDEVPTCPFCEQAMKLNTRVSTDATRSYICSCQGTIFHVNIHRRQTGAAERDS